MINSQFYKKVSGQNIKIGKYYSFYCKIIKKKYYYKVKIKIILSKNIGYEATGKGKLPYDSLNLAIFNLRKILRRHQRKLKNGYKVNKQVRVLKESFLLFNIIQ